MNTEIKNKEYNVYIDESGDEGINKGSKYFILTALFQALKYNDNTHFNYVFVKKK